MRIRKLFYHVMNALPGYHATLYEAAANGDTKTVRRLLEGGAEANAKKAGWTPLHFAARYGETSCVDVLLVHGADVGITDELGWPPFNTAIRFCHTVFVRELLTGTARERIDLDLRDNIGRSALHLAARWDGDGDITALVLEHGAHPDVQDSRGVTPLHIAAHHGNRFFVETLLQKADHVEVTISSVNKTPAEVAMESGHPAIAKLIRDYAANQ